MKPVLCLFLALSALNAADAPLTTTRRLDLAAAGLERYRYTLNPALLATIREHLDAVRSADPDNFLLNKLTVFRAALEEDFDTALKLGEKLNRKTPDEIDVYGYLVDAYSAYGRYDEAEKQATWMLRLRHENRQGMRRFAELRVAYGDVEGAILMLNEIHRFIPHTEPVERSWVFARLAALTVPSTPARAEQLARESLKLEPESFEGATSLAAALVRLNRPAEAADVLAPLAKRTNRAFLYFQLGLALRAAGKTSEAATAFLEFDRLSANSTRLSDIQARTQYLLDIATRPAEALHLINRFSSYKNVWSLSLEASALAANGRPEDARKTMQAALAVGSKELRVLEIAHRLESTK